MKTDLPPRSPASLVLLVGGAALVASFVLPWVGGEFQPLFGVSASDLGLKTRISPYDLLRADVPQTLLLPLAGVLVLLGSQAVQRIRGLALTIVGAILLPGALLYWYFSLDPEVVRALTQANSAAADMSVRGDVVKLVVENSGVGVWALVVGQLLALVGLGLASREFDRSGGSALADRAKRVRRAKRAAKGADR
jgi:hypothetical protein